MVYINSFTVTQKEMLESVMRVTGTTLEEWAIRKNRGETGIPRD